MKCLQSDSYECNSKIYYHDLNGNRKSIQLKVHVIQSRMIRVLSIELQKLCHFQK